MNEKRLGQAIAKERIAHHMTPNALAEKLMVDAKTVIAWETGDVAPSVGDLAAICEALELKEDFFTLEETADFSADEEEGPFDDWKTQRAYWEKKWKDDHKALRYGYAILVVVLVMVGFFMRQPLLNAAACFVAIGGYLKINNDKMTYIESKIPMKED